MELTRLLPHQDHLIGVNAYLSVQHRRSSTNGYASDFLCHRNPSSCTNYTSDITDLGRYYYKNDLARMAAMGITHYSFSVSWTRVVPFGKKGSPVSNEGLDYYEDICKTALSFGIKPVITLFHWDTPANLLFEYGGFLNGTIVDDYYYYADIVFRRLGKYAETFFTFNEPRVYCKRANVSAWYPY